MRQAKRTVSSNQRSPGLIGDLELGSRSALKDARLALIQHGRVRHELQSEHFLLLAAGNSARMRCDGKLTSGSLDSK